MVKQYFIPTSIFSQVIEVDAAAGVGVAPVTPGTYRAIAGVLAASSLTVSADVTAPTISSSSPADNATGVAVGVSPTITFSENVKFGTGLITLRQNNGGWSDVETFDVVTEVGTGNGQVSISGAVLTINPTSDLVGGREYAIRIAATAIDDLADNSFAGIADDTTLSFTAASGAPSVFHTQSGTGPYFVDPANVPANTTKIEFKANIYATGNPGATCKLFTQESTGFDLTILSTGGFQVTVENGGGTNVVTSGDPPPGTLPTGAWTELAVEADQVAGTAAFYINGVLNKSWTWTPGASQFFQTTREISFCGTTGGGSLLPSGWQVEFVEAYFTTGGVRTLRKRIEGNAATVNADAWKLGANAT